MKFYSHVKKIGKSYLVIIYSLERGEQFFLYAIRSNEFLRGT